jgi:hypothetical protein
VSINRDIQDRRPRLREAMRITLLVLMLVAGGLARGEAAAGVNELAWLTGCWESQSVDRIVEEQWTAPRAAACSASVARSKAMPWWNMNSSRYANATIASSISRTRRANLRRNSPRARFQQTVLSSRTLSTIFRNESAISGHVTGSTRGLTVRHDGRTQRVEFHYRRGACEPK